MRLLSGVGTGLLLTSSLLLLARSLLPAATALATASLVARVGDGALAPVPLLAVLLAGLVTEHLMDPLRYAVVRRVDGAHRRAVEAAAAAPVGIAHLETAAYQDDLRRAAGEPDNWTEGTPGAAGWAQLKLLFTYLSVFLAAAVVARDVPWLAATLVVALLGARAVQRRELMKPVHAWAAGLPRRRRAEYWTSILTEPATAKEVRVFRLGDWIAGQHRADAEGHLAPFRAAKFAKLRRQWIWLLLIVVVMALSLYTLGAMAARGELPVSRLAGDLAAVASMLGVVIVSQGMLELETGQPPLLALLRLLSWPTPQSTPQGTPRQRAAPEPSAGVRFEGVTFAYPGTGRPVLNGLDLQLRPGEALALVGLNGAGKTTVAKLLARLYEPDAGRITVDGTDVRDLDLGAWRARLTVVFQDFLRYQLSAADNMALGRAGPPSPDRLRQAAADAGITTLIDELPDGWATNLSPGRTGGVDLSGGQWQRVALARALYAMRDGACVLVLDEPTAHLDVRTEREVFRQVAAAARGRASVLLISHRLATVREADRIALIAGGRVSESGTHDELMALGGAYARMFRIQAERVLGGGPS